MQIVSAETLFLVLFCGAFVKIAATLCVVRVGIGLDSSLFGSVLAILAFAMSLLVLQPVFDQVEKLNASAQEQKGEPKNLEKVFGEFFELNTLPSVSEQITSFQLPAKTLKEAASEKKTGLQSNGEKLLSRKSFAEGLAGFLLSEIIRAFELALILLIPFLVIDLAVVNILALLGIQQISAQLISLPLKIALMISLDAWLLIFQRLLLGYQFPGGLS